MSWRSSSFVSVVYRTPGTRTGFKRARNSFTKASLPNSNNLANLATYLGQVPLGGKNFCAYVLGTDIESRVPIPTAPCDLDSEMQNPYATKNDLSKREQETANFQEEVSPTPRRKKNFTLNTLNQRHRKGIKMSMLTAYDYSGGIVAAAANVDIVLVGDSLGMVVLGHEDTTGVKQRFLAFK